VVDLNIGRETDEGLGTKSPPKRFHSRIDGQWEGDHENSETKNGRQPEERANEPEKVPM